MQYDFANAPADGGCAGLRRVGVELGLCEAQRVLGQRHVKLVEHQVDTGRHGRLKTQLTIELFALGAAVVAVTLGVKGAVVRYQAYATDPPCVLHVSPVHAVRAHVILGAGFGRCRRIACERLNHTA